MSENAADSQTDYGIEYGRVCRYIIVYIYDLYNWKEKGQRQDEWRGQKMRRIMKRRKSGTDGQEREEKSPPRNMVFNAWRAATCVPRLMLQLFAPALLRVLRMYPVPRGKRPGEPLGLIQFPVRLHMQMRSFARFRRFVPTTAVPQRTDSSVRGTVAYGVPSCQWAALAVGPRLRERCLSVPSSTTLSMD